MAKPARPLRDFDPCHHTSRMGQVGQIPRQNVDGSKARFLRFRMNPHSSYDVPCATRTTRLKFEAIFEIDSKFSVYKPEVQATPLTSNLVSKDAQDLFLDWFFLVCEIKSRESSAGRLNVDLSVFPPDSFDFGRSKRIEDDHFRGRHQQIRCSSFQGASFSHRGGRIWTAAEGGTARNVGTAR